MDNDKYHISFIVRSHPSGVTGDEEEFSRLQNEGRAPVLCDSILQIVMIHDRKGGKKDYQVLSMDGERSKPLELREQWEAWYVFGRALSQLMDKNDPTHGWQQNICAGVVEVCQAMRKGAKRKDS